jgi:hypothetical protein
MVEKMVVVLIFLSQIRTQMGIFFPVVNVVKQLKTG